MELYVCKCSNNAGPQYIKVLHEAQVSVISILQKQFALYHNKFISTHTATCFLSLHTTLKLSEIMQKIRITIYSYTQLNNNAGTGTKLWRKTRKIMNSTSKSIKEGKRGNPTAWCEADDRTKDIQVMTSESSTDTHREDLMTCLHFQGRVSSRI